MNLPEWRQQYYRHPPVRSPRRGSRGRSCWSQTTCKLHYTVIIPTCYTCYTKYAFPLLFLSIWFKTFKGDAVLGDIFSPSTAESSAIGVPAEAVGVDVAPVDDLVLVLHVRD